MCEPTAEQHEDDQAKDHSDARSTEPPVPACCRVEAFVDESLMEGFTLGEIPADEWRKHGADIDAHVKDREPAVATRIVFAVETADHRADVWFEKTRTNGDEYHAQIERIHGVKHHREVAGSDDEPAEKDGESRPEQVIGRESARQSS